MRTPAIPKWDEVNKRWFLTAQRNGVRKWFYSSKEGRAGSSDVRRKRQLWLDGQADKSTWRLERAWESYLEDVQIRTGKANYRQIHNMGMYHILNHLGMKRLSSISEQDWQDCINKAYKKNLSYKTLSGIRGTITGFCKFARKSRMLDYAPELAVPKDAHKVGKKILNPDQIRLLFEPSDEWYINAWRFMVVTGLRPGEVYGLMNDDIKVDMLTISRSLTEYGMTKGKSKNAQRKMKLHALALSIICEQQAKVKHLNSLYTFPDALGHVSHPKVIYQHWQRWARSRGIQTTPYALRHTFVSMTQHELPPELIKRIVGHSESMDTFGIYGHAIDGELVRAANMLDGVFGEYKIQH